MIPYSALTQGLALENKNLTMLPEFMSNMFTALIYTCKLSHDQFIKKEESLAHISIPQNVPVTQHC